MTFFFRQKKHVSSFTSWRNSSDFFSPQSDLFGHDWTGTKNSETVACFVSCVAAILIKNYVLLSSLGIRDCVQKLIGLNRQIYKYQNVAQQLIQTHYFMIHMFSEGYPSNLLYSTIFFSFIHLTPIILVFVKGVDTLLCTRFTDTKLLHTSTVNRVFSYLRSKKKEILGPSWSLQIYYRDFHLVVL